ncbi:MAG TPA: acyl transferase [Flavipsychrobacter sp.]|nr:acyl transferase [Flavipsychrobacter sp.]
MKIKQGYIHSINEANFEETALEIFQFQYEKNELYRNYVQLLNTDVAAINQLDKIPFLPISFFKTHTVLCGNELPELFFQSSGTTGEQTSKHYIIDEELYRQSLIHGFRQYYGAVEDYTILALLPSYLERKNASLVFMSKVFMEHSQQPHNGFYLNEWQLLATVLKNLEANGQKTLLLGVTFALLDFATQFPFKLKHTLVMETGGMKGRGKELTREEVHAILKTQWQLADIHSEYGMTELLSQAYALKDGVFQPTNSLKVFIRDINDPLEVKQHGVGVLNIIDLANLHSCSFIATEDLGRIYPNGNFEVIGRMDNTALRGCSLMAV